MKDNKILEVVEIARETGKLRKGINETTKSVERNEAKLVIVAQDINPPEIAMHLQALCDEKKISLVTTPSKLELGRAAGVDVGTSSIAIVEAGDASKKLDDVIKGAK